MGMPCLLVAALLVTLGSVRAPNCYSLHRSLRPALDGPDPWACSDPFCCANAVKFANYPVSVFDSVDNECTFHRSNQSVGTDFQGVTFVKDQSCSPEPLCRIPNLYIPQSEGINAVQEGDCETLCQYGSNCMGASWHRTADICYFSKTSTLMSGVAPLSDYISYVRCWLTTTTPSPATTTLISTSLTTSTTTTIATATTNTNAGVCSKGQNQLLRVFGNGKFEDGGIADTHQVRSYIECAIECTRHEECGLFSYHQAERICSIFNRMTSSFTVTSLAGWQSWTILNCY